MKKKRRKHPAVARRDRIVGFFTFLLLGGWAVLLVGGALIYALLFAK